MIRPCTGHSIALTTVVFALLISLSNGQENRAGERNVLFGDEFWKQWGDGRAELAGYELTITQYGQQRKGVAVTIFVTERFNDEKRVKAEPPKRSASGRTGDYSVMKLNLIKDFPTGIYDYNMMSSIFVALEPLRGRPAGSPVKVSFSAQEWCGHVYHQLLFDKSNVRQEQHSYFEARADSKDTLPYPQSGIAEDTLFHWARGFAGPVLVAGETVDVRMLTSLQTARLKNEGSAWKNAKLSRAGETARITVPAGMFEVEQFTAAIEAGDKWTFYIEKASPRRIIKWERGADEVGELLASERLKYWEMQADGQKAVLDKLGLSARPPRTN